MSAFVPSWSDIKAAWSSGWKALSEQAAAAHATALQVDPTGTAARVEAFLAALGDSRATLDRIAAKLPNPPVTGADRTAVANYEALERRYHDIAAGFYADAKPAPQTPAVGLAPVVLVVAGLAVGAIGIAWAIAAYQYAVNLREQTSLAERELDARVEASRDGRALQSSTLPPPPSPAADAKGVGLWLLGGLAVAAGALAIPILMKR